MPFLATLTFTLVVCTVANMLGTVQGPIAHALNLDAKMVILISCAGGLVSSAAMFVFTRLIHRKTEVALHMDSLPDNLKASGKVRQLCRGLAGPAICRPLGHLLQASFATAGRVLSFCGCSSACNSSACTRWGIAALRPCCLGRDELRWADPAGLKV